MNAERAGEKRPYLDFYTSHNISPVAQDIAALDKHFQRRESLYRHLGIPASLLSGRAIIEFGPGSGYNALFTATLKPSRYVLVDGNPLAIDHINENFRKHQVSPEAIEVRHSLIEEFKSDERFDLVLCEGVLPWQLRSKEFARCVAKFARPGGIVVLTCIDAVSFLGESIRRLMATRFSPFNDPMEQRIAATEPFFTPHLKTLAGMSRPVRDWLQDNIIIKYYAGFFSISDAIEALDPEFSFFGSSPDFGRDWRWYKDLFGNQRAFNSQALHQYYENVANFADYRVTLPSHAESTGRTLLRIGQELFDLMLKIEERGGSKAMFDCAADLVHQLTEIPELAPLTRASFNEAAAFLGSPASSTDFPLPNFQSFFGRGQQYVSFIRG